MWLTDDRVKSKRAVRWCSLMLLCLVAGSVSAQQPARITITEIQRDRWVAGTVTGLDDPANWRVIVYVHTDQWYVHPYAAQGDGQTFTAINPDGKWKIQSVKREFAADQIAALVVSKDIEIPSKVGNIQSIPNRAIDVEPVTKVGKAGDI